MIKILVTVSGGVVTAVYAANAINVPIEAVICDYDDDSRTEDDAELNVWFSDGQTVQRFMQQVQLGNPQYKEITEIAGDDGGT